MPTPVQHAEALLGAIETLKRLEASGQSPAPADLEALRGYPGAGCVALDLFPDPQTHAYKSPAWGQRGLALRNLCTDEEYESLLRSTFSAFYTSPLVMQAAFVALARCGVPDTARILEPGCGIGNFLAYAPEAMRVVGVELDRVSARITVQLWPGQDIRQGDLTSCAVPENLDAAVGNVPFADVRYDYDGQRFSLHEVCLARAIDSLKPGGIAALVITHSFLDREQPRFREYVACQADLLGAIRLPSTAFADQGTKVIADLVVLQKFWRRSIEEPYCPVPLSAWMDSLPMDIDGAAVPVNAYFHDHPEMVLGTWSLKDRLYGSTTSYSVEPPADLPTALLQALQTLPANVFPAQAEAVEEAEEDVSVERRDLPDSARQLPEGALYLDPADGTVCQRTNNHGVQALYSGKALSAASGLVGKRVAALIRLREQAREVLRRQHAGATPSERQAARSLLTMQHALFVSQHGPINKTTLTPTASGGLQRRLPNLAKFRDDPDSMLVAALEDYDEDSNTATRTAIFTRDVVGQDVQTTQVASAEAALLASLDQTGGVDVPLMADLYGKSQTEILAELSDLLYQDPATGRWETADQYLSGNVRARLQAAQLAGSAYARNVTALAAVQPPDLLPSEIEANLGAPWIPPSDIETFLRELCEASSHWRCTITHVPKEAVWAVDRDWRYEECLAMRTTYGTSRVNGVTLLEQALNLRLPTVWDSVGYGDAQTKVQNQPETIAAREKQQQLKEAFKAWLWKDAARTDRLVRVYNDLHNNLRMRAFDGSHLTFPGMAAHITLDPHQKDGAWRIMSGGNTLLAHPVGYGKSFCMMAAAMKLRQAGRIRKPLFVEPNHMLEQFIRECLQLYPNARMLLASSEDMSKRKRKLLAARIATGQWDGIITTHSAFERMGMSVGYQARFLRDLIRQYEAVLTDELPETRGGDKGRQNLRKQLEKQKARYEEKLEALLAAEKKDDSLVFDELGIDYVFVDESQQFKNLETPSKLQNVAGIQTQGSQRAFDMALKLRYLQEQHPGQSVTFASGTPISNTMVEMYTLQRYLDPQGLADGGIAHFDAWAATYGEITEVSEIAVDGRSMRSRQRFAKFVNVAELQQQFRGFADVLTKGTVHLAVPTVAGGKAQVIACPMSATQKRLQDALVDRYEAIRGGKVKPWEDNALAVTTDGRKLALDARLLDGQAPPNPASKLQACAEQVLAMYHATREQRATQLVFCDLGVNPTAWGFSVYGTFLDLLVKGGMPREECAAIQEATNDGAKHALFERVRHGQVAVLIGSTIKMGTGTNVQHRLLALHHLDAPWKPAEVEQREGRIVRQKNMHKEVSLYTYVTEGSFDAYMWQALQTKAQFIGQMMHGSLTTREVQDVDEQALTYAEVKAIASGNPHMLTLAHLEAECRRLHVLRNHHADSQYRAQQTLRFLPDDIARLEHRLVALCTDLALLATSTSADPWHLHESIPTLPQQVLDTGETVTPPDDPEARLTLWSQTLRQVVATQDFPVGTYRGLQITLRLHSMVPPQVLVQGAIRYDSPLDKRFGLGRSLVRAVGHLLENYPLYERGLATEIERHQRSLAQHSAALGQEWPQEAYARQLTTLRRELKQALMDKPPEGTREASAVVADLDALRASQHATTQAPTDSTPRTLSIAQPITAQIRARQDTALTTEAGA